MDPIAGLTSVFSRLHDGFVESWEGDAGLLRLYISCQYLASRIDPQFRLFVLELETVSRLTLNCWTLDRSPQVLTTPAGIFRGLLEFVSAATEDGIVTVTCYQSDPDLNYTGGMLQLRCGGWRLLDEARRDLPVAELINASKTYWENFGK